jgi:hypothetical protein
VSARGFSAALWLLLAGCATPVQVSPTDAMQLRVRNTGPADAVALHVLFPAADVDFGDVPAGATSDYRAVPGGVYRYGAYRLRIDGRDTTVPVIDWVGEKPMPRGAYTYVVAVDPRSGQPVSLVGVERDR